jgi:SAM-dependent methyltransferase
MRHAHLPRGASCLGLVAMATLTCAPAGEPKEKKDRAPDVRYVATPPEVVDKMLEVAKLTRGDVVYDLGCGDGRIVIAAAKKYRCKAVGFDIDPQRVKDSEANRARLDRETRKLVSFHKKDIFTLDLRGASVVMLYLLPELNVKLVPQLKKMKPGSRIVSHSWGMRGFKPDDGFPIKVRKKDGYQRDVYRWTTPLRREED